MKKLFLSIFLTTLCFTYSPFGQVEKFTKPNEKIWIEVEPGFHWTISKSNAKECVYHGKTFGTEFWMFTYWTDSNNCTEDEFRTYSQRVFQNVFSNVRSSTTRLEMQPQTRAAFRRYSVTDNKDTFPIYVIGAYYENCRFYFVIQVPKYLESNVGSYIGDILSQCKFYKNL